MLGLSASRRPSLNTINVDEKSFIYKYSSGFRRDLAWWVLYSDKLCALIKNNIVDISMLYIN